MSYGEVAGRADLYGIDCWRSGRRFYARGFRGLGKYGLADIMEIENKIANLCKK